MRRAVLAAAVVFTCARSVAFADDGSYDYVTRAGDTCVGIATRELGDRTAYLEIHRLNPALGPLPHNLQPGTVLKLPRRSTAPADARLTGARGDVKVMRPAVTSWDAGLRGMDLFRSWRVSAEDRSSAELTFLDTTRLFLREHTLVVIYGATVLRAATSSTRAELESGALETRLAAVGKHEVIVTSPSAETRHRDGKQLVVVDAAKTTIVANHAGGAVSVRGVDAKRRARGATVAVSSGMGSKVVSGGTPTPPRPLPAAPAWQTGYAGFIDLGPSGATVTAAWAPISTAARYRVAVTSPSGDDVAAVEVPSGVTAFELRGTPPGMYAATVATIDGEGFESAPSTSLSLEVVAVQIVPAAAPAVTPAVIPPVAPQPALAIELGTRFVASGDVTCRVDGGTAAADVMITDPTARQLRCQHADGRILTATQLAVTAPRICASSCTNLGGPTRIARGTRVKVHYELAGAAAIASSVVIRASAQLSVVSVTPVTGGLELELEAAPDAPRTASLTFSTAGGAQLATVEIEIEARAEAPVIAPLHVRQSHAWELGAFAGARVFQHGSELGNPGDPSYALQAGPIAGARVSLWPSRWLGGELEVAIGSLGRDGAPGATTVLSGRALVGVRRTHGRIGARLLVGAGFDDAINEGTRTQADLDPVFLVGAAVTAAVTSTWALRLDARDPVAPSSHGLVHGLETAISLAHEF